MRKGEVEERKSCEDFGEGQHFRFGELTELAVLSERSIILKLNREDSEYLTEKTAERYYKVNEDGEKNN